MNFTDYTTNYQYCLHIVKLSCTLFQFGVKILISEYNQTSHILKGNKPL